MPKTRATSKKAVTRLAPDSESKMALGTDFLASTYVKSKQVKKSFIGTISSDTSAADSNPKKIQACESNAGKNISVGAIPDS